MVLLVQSPRGFNDVSISQRYNTVVITTLFEQVMRTLGLCKSSGLASHLPQALQSHLGDAISKAFNLLQRTPRRAYQHQKTSQVLRTKKHLPPWRQHSSASCPKSRSTNSRRMQDARFASSRTKTKPRTAGVSKKQSAYPATTLIFSDQNACQNG